MVAQHAIEVTNIPTGRMLAVTVTKSLAKLLFKSHHSALASGRFEPGGVLLHPVPLLRAKSVSPQTPRAIPACAARASSAPLPAPPLLLALRCFTLFVAVNY